MTKKKIPDRKRAFFRWLAKGPKEREEQAKHAIDLFLPILEDAGFDWVEHEFDGGRAQVNSVSLEREQVPGQIDFIVIIFDKNRTASFQVAVGRKEKQYPHHWIRGGSIVWGKSGLDKHNWWGAKWHSVNKRKAFEDGVMNVAKAFPQALKFLSDGTVGPQIWEPEIGGS